jgi:hypothetical protein
MLPYAGYVDPESTLAIGVHHDGHLEATERTFCSLYHTFMFGFHPFAVHPSNVFTLVNEEKKKAAFNPLVN